MLDDYLKRDDVCQFIKEIRSNERYFLKNKDSFFNDDIYIYNEVALYIFYEALYKYKLVLDDIYLFDEYLIQLEKLYKKLDNFDDILYGINKLIGKMVSIKLDINDPNGQLAKKELVSYIYNKYIVDGYLIHGFNTSYSDEVCLKGLIPGDYLDNGDKLDELNRIFAKYNVFNIIDKDDSQLHFTDNLLMSCYYSNYSPMYFYKFLNSKEYFGKRIKQDGYLLDDYEKSISNLKKYMSDNLFNENDRKIILDIVSDEWKLLHRKDKKISLLLVKRSLFGVNDGIQINDYLNDEDDFYDICDKILVPKFSSITCSEKIDKDNLIVLNLDGYYLKEEISALEIEQEELYKYQEEEISKEFLNVYGKASILILIGSLLITLGVIITILVVLGGNL